MRIPPTEASWHPSSSGADPKGRLFEWHGTLYRAVLPSHTATCEWLVSSQVGQRLQARRWLVETQPTPFILDGYGMVLRHRRVPFVSYPFEWCAAMLRDAGIRLLDLNDELVRAGYITKDPSAWNVLFDGSTAVYVDVSNIWPLDEIAHLFGEWPDWFARFFLNPLKLMARGHGRIARSLLQDYEHGIERRDYETFVAPLSEMFSRGVRSTTATARQGIRRFLPAQTVGNRSPRPAVPPQWSPLQWLDVLQRLRRELESIPCAQQPSKWSRSCDSPSAPSPEERDRKHLIIDALLERFRPPTVVDIGGTMEWSSKNATNTGATVAVLDAEECALTVLYQKVREMRLAVLPVVQNLKHPSPTFGLCNRRMRSAPERFGTDLVLALDLVHHLAIRQCMHFDEIVESLDLFARRWLLVEFVDQEDSALQKLYSGHLPGWYTFAGFREALTQRFNIVEQCGPHPSTRLIFLCQKGGNPS